MPLRASLVAATLLLATLSVVRPTAAGAEGEITGTVPASGVGIVLWGGGNATAVAPAAATNGCSLQSFWITSGGRLDGYVAGAPAFVNGAFLARFPAGVVPAQTPLILVCTAGPSSPAPAPAKPPVLPPPGATVAGAEWISVAAPAGKTILAAVFRPASTAPAPAIVLLHGSAGFSNSFLELAKEFASNGYVAVVGCWFGGHYDASRTGQPGSVVLADGIDCPDAPSLKGDTAFVDDIAPLLQATRELPGVRPGSLAIMGHSRGSVAALTVGGVNGGVDAIVASAGTLAGAASTLIAFGISAPVLLLQGEADTVIPAADTRAQEAALRAFGKPVQAEYYAGAGHDYLFQAPWRAAAIQRTVTFLRETLR